MKLELQEAQPREANRDNKDHLDSLVQQDRRGLQDPLVHVVRQALKARMDNQVSQGLGEK